MNKYVSYNPNALASTTSIIVIILVFLTLAIQVFGAGITRINWGINQVGYLPGFLHYAWLLFALVLVAFLFLSPGKHFVSAFLSRFFWGDRKLIGRVVFLIAALVILLIFRFDAHLYGDGYVRVANFAQKTKPIFRWFEYGSTLIPYTFYSILLALGQAKVSAAVLAYQIVSFSSGLIFIFFSFKISECISEKDDDRIVFFLLTIFSGVTLLFFGMVENTPILLPAIAMFIYYFLLLNQREKSKYLYYVWCISILGLFLHIQFIAVLPVLLYLSLKFLIRRGKIGSFLGLLVASVAIVSIVAIVYLKSIGNIALTNLILFPTGKPPEIDYALFNGRHLADIFNLFFLLIPLFAVYLFSIALAFAGLRNDRNFTGLGILAVSQFIFLFVIDPKHGMARDLHMFGFLLTGVMFWGVYSLLKARQHFRLPQDVFMTLCPIALLIIVPAFYVHLSPAATEKYIDEFLLYNETKYESALLAFRDYYIVEEDYQKASQREKSITGKVPGALESQLVNDLYAHERVNEAFEYALQLVERNPYNATYRMQKGNLLKHYKRYGDAEKELLIAIELEPYKVLLYHFLSELYRTMRLEQDCHDVLWKALSIDPKSATILVDLTGYYFRTGRFKEADSLANVVADLAPDEPYSYMYKGLIAERTNHKSQALEYYTRFIELNDNLPESPQIRKRMNDIVLEMKDTTSQE